MGQETKYEDIYGGKVLDIPRQSSRCRVIVYSYVDKIEGDKSYNGVLDCSRDVVQCDCSKTIKGGGGAAVVLVPRRNYMNYVFPNDLINIYFDPGDGRGFIRTFFGYVDRVDRNTSTDQQGGTTTRFQLTCTDFTKAFAKAFVHFAPHLADRGDFVSSIFDKNIGGAALRTKGVSITGNPADIVASLSFLVLGFGAQFKLPKSYPLDNAFVKSSRRQKLEWAKERLPDAIQNNIGTKSLEEFKDFVKEKYNQLIERAIDEQLPPLQKNVGKKRGRVRLSVSPKLILPTGDPLTSSFSELSQHDGISAQYEAINKSPAFAAAKEQEVTLMNLGRDNHLFDLVDFRFIEFDAIDGSILATPIWSSSGPVWNIMNSWSNDMINELFCDLRPVNYSKEKDFVDGAYTKAPDETKGNIGGSGDSVKFAPSIVMREYPFSTIEGVPEGPTPVYIFKTVRLGPIPFTGKTVSGGTGGIFSQQPGSSGRRVVDIKALSPYQIVLTKGKAQAAKHLDTVTISSRDIITERIGRSDADVVNLIEVFSDFGLGPNHQFLTQDVQPVANPISIVRDGLRVRRYTTKYARWPAERYKSGGVDSAMTRFQTVRWAMMLDHWYQHNIEYLNGTITTRAFPEIRVGYRLDIAERNESYYVEGTNNSWSYAERGGMLTSSFTLSRGQRNDPYPVYVTPALQNFGGLNNRDGDSRLAVFFNQMDPHAVRGSSIIYGEETTKDALKNTVDVPSKKRAWSQIPFGFLSAGSTAITSDEEAALNEQKSIDAAIESISKLGATVGDAATKLFDNAKAALSAGGRSSGVTK